MPLTRNLVPEAYVLFYYNLFLTSYFLLNCLKCLIQILDNIIDIFGTD